MYLDRIKCEYCGRVNPSSEFDCRGCGSGLMPDPIKHDDGTRTWKMSNEYGKTVSALWATTDAAMSSDDGTMGIGDTDYYGFDGVYST